MMKMMNTKGNPKIHTLLLLVTVFLFGTRQAMADNVYLSLYLGNITFNASNQLETGAYKWNGSSFAATTAVEALVASNTYVIGMWDTNENPITTQFKPVTTICGGSVVIVGNPEDPYATNARAEGVPTLNEWDVEAPIAASGYTTRRSCGSTNGKKFKITINVLNFDLDLRLDNVWCTYSTANSADSNKGLGAINFTPSTSSTNTSKIYIDLVGDNRLTSIRVTNDNSKTTETEIHLGMSKAGVRSTGTLTAGIYKAPSVSSSSTDNHYCAVIGSRQLGSGSPCYGIFIDGGTIYVGAVKDDHNTCIGGGGNTDGYVTITGGTVTAVNATTGSTIGGGRGWSSRGGDGFVTITGGTVYAYNYGDRSGDSGYAPNCAIGGGSSQSQDAHKGTATVVISEASASNPTYVYAEALGAPAIGGGSSYRSAASSANFTYSDQGADATITITGGTIKAISKSGQIKSYNGTTLSQSFYLGRVAIGGGIGASGGALTFNMSGGTLTAIAEGGIAIGGGYAGGTGAAYPGGNATITISGASTVIDARSIETSDGSTTYPATMSIGGGDAVRNNANSPGGDIDFTMHGGTLMTGSIGGGINTKANASNGTGTFVIDGGTLHGQLILWEDAASSSLTMSGGSIQGKVSNGNTYTYIQNFGGGVYLGNGTFDMSDGTITGCSAEEGGGVYLGNGTFNMSDGSITSCTATKGGGVYQVSGTFDMSDGSITDCSTSSVSLSSGGGAALYQESGFFNMSGGIITNNSATQTGDNNGFLAGAIYKGGTMYVSGSPVVKGNTFNGQPNNVYIPTVTAEDFIYADNVINPDGIECGASIGVSKLTRDHSYTNGEYTNITQLENELITNNSAPIYGTYTECFQKCEFIIPAGELGGLINKTIHGLTFHSNNITSATSFGAARFQVFMKVVDATTISAYGFASGTTNRCYNGALSLTADGLMTITFSSDFYYTGGNLQIGIWETTKSNSSDWHHVTFYGKSVPGACIASQNTSTSASLASLAANQLNFIPKTTFSTIEGVTWVYPNIALPDNTSTILRNRAFFDDTETCGVYNSPVGPSYFDASSKTLYLVKYTTTNNDFFLDAASAVAGTDYTVSNSHVSSILTAKGLAFFSTDVESGKDYAGKTVTLENDLNLGGYQWYPIGFSTECDVSNSTFAGTFDGQGHVIYNLNCNYDYKDLGLFGHVTGTVKNVIVSGTVSGSATNLGGIAGEVGDGGEIYNSISMVSPTSGTNFGSFVGKVGSGGSLKNSFANTTCTNGLVGDNEGTVENCYVRGTTAKVGSGTISSCYASTDGSDGDYTAVVKPYVYGLFDNVVRSTNVPLVKTLNNWVDSQGSGTDYAHWARPTTDTINGDYPILKMPDQNAVAANSDAPTVLHYNDVNSLIGSYTTKKDAIYLYGSKADVSSNSGSSAKLIIDEDAAITQTGAIVANVGVTLKNTQNSTNSWDWHMFSPALSNAPLGISYIVSGTNENVNNTDYQYAYMSDPPLYTFTGLGYFPTAADEYYREWDYYCYYEPQYHWINFKRNGISHWHEDGAHEHIDYIGDAVNVNESVMKPGKGYLLATKRETMLQCKGTLNNADISIAITTDGPYRTGYNLIGNPFQSYYDFNTFASDNASLWGGIGKASYILLSGDAYTAYAYNASNNTLTAPRWLHPHQGFMIVASNSGTATFYNSKRIVEGQSEFRSEPQPNYALINLIATDEDGNRDITTVELNRPDKGGAVKAYDLHLGKGCIYTHYEGEDYSIAFTQPGITEVGVRFEADEEATFTMTWDMENGNFDYLHLIDNKTGTDTDCLSASEYRFSASPDDYKSRFKLAFNYTGIEEPEDSVAVDRPASFVFLMGNEMVVNGEGLLQLFDLTGRTVMERTVHGTQTVTTLPVVASGVYVARLKGVNGTQTQKIIIRK